jgi:hypothetical protein
MKKIIVFTFISIAVVIVASLGSCTKESMADPTPNIPVSDSLRVSKYQREWIYYAQVNKQGNYFRRMFIDTASASQVRQTGNIPTNALFAMETWFGNNQSTVYIRQKSNEWTSGSFSPNNPVYGLTLQTSCNSCHNRASSTDLTFTKPLLQKALVRNRVQIIECNESSFNPCDLAVYQGN